MSSSGDDDLDSRITREQPQREPQGEAQPGSSNDAGPADSSRTRRPATPSISLGRSREKKRVGFVGDHSRQGSDDSLVQSPGTLVSSAASTPAVPDSPGYQEQIDEDELSEALHKILGPEQQHDGHPRAARASLPLPPRPVLRKQGFHHRQASDEDALGGQARPLRQSEVDARDRADRLASALSSGRTSVDLDEESFIMGYNTGGDAYDGEDASFASADHQHQEVPDLRRQSSEAQQVATDLVRNHTRRRAAGAAAPASLQPPLAPQIEDRDLAPGQMTPMAPDVDYVPRPNKYRGGILASLLQLYAAEDGQAGDSDASLPSTPSRTPRTSPTSSRPGTPGEREPRERRRSGGLFRLRGNQSSSSLTLAGLVEASSTALTAPGSGGISEKVAGKFMGDARRPASRSSSPGVASSRKSRRRSRAMEKQTRMEDEIRIKFHIAEIISRHKYLVKLCRALMLYGAPTHRLEAYMAMSARVLGIEGQFLYLPGCMVVSFDDSSTHTTEVQIVRAGQGLDLGKLRDVHEIYKEVVHDLIGVDEANRRLEDVFTRKHKFANLTRVLVYGLASLSVAPFAFEGRWVDLPVAFALGCILGLLQLVLAPSNELYANVFEISAAVITSFLARAFGSLRGGKLFCFSALAQSSIALILPGYIVLCGSLELQSHNIVAGSVRMVYAMIYSLFLGYGITIGSVLYGYLDPNATSNVHCDNPLSDNKSWSLLFVPLFTLCLCIVNQAKWRQMPVMLGISLAGYCVNSYSSAYFRGDTQVSNTLGALCVGILANLYSRLSRHVENFSLDLWEFRLEPFVRRHSRRYRRSVGALPPTPPYPTESDPPDMETAPAADGPEATMAAPPDAAKREAPGAHGQGRLPRQVGYGLAVAAMLPAIFVQVPSGLAVGGSLLSGVTSANMITGNKTAAEVAGQQGAVANGAAFSFLLNVIQVAIGISVGLSMSALLVYPFGKRRSGLFSL